MTNLSETIPYSRAIENGFPIDFVSRLAEHESWRKEIYRPLYYLHKWWARRLGSVFRAIILGSCLLNEDNGDVEKLFYEASRLPDVTVFDPFMGSGTTIGEAVKLGCRAIGRDINPVSNIMVRAALQRYTAEDIQTAYQEIEATAGQKIKELYSVKLPDGKLADVLYYFWVKLVPCPLCGQEIELFKTRIFSRNATPSKHPEAKATCPNCHAINETLYDAKKTVCNVCDHVYNPQIGSVVDRKVRCHTCKGSFAVIDAVRRLSTPPNHKLFAKMVLTEANEKRYLLPNHQDDDMYLVAEGALGGLLGEIPQVEIQAGYNTNQILNYNYQSWHQLFNARQLVSFAYLSSAIRRIEIPELRHLFACLLSSTLEFNNMFCSFKGEGTGAVRPVFANHILKPELTPLEANVWGTPKSSGGFSTLFESRILRALEYKANPFEFKLNSHNGKPQNVKVFGLSDPINYAIANTHEEFVKSNAKVYLSVGDSAHTDIPNGTVGVVITDPPFFDNVHYSQLADFFYVWLHHLLGESPVGEKKLVTTRSPNEVQDVNADSFAVKLASVFKECYRVLKKNGIFVFTYHHSRIDGWVAMYRAIREAGFYVTHANPVKAEMAVSIPVMQSKSPINYDLIIACRKEFVRGSLAHDDIPIVTCLGETKTIVQKLQKADLIVSAGDVKVIFLGCVLAKLSEIGCLEEEIEFLKSIEQRTDGFVQEVMQANETAIRGLTTVRPQTAGDSLRQGILAI